jgi:hypothetical protein
MLGEEDGARVVGREQDAWLTDLLRETQQAAQHPVHVSRAGLPEEAPGQVARVRGRSPRSLVHPVDRYASPSQTADDPQAAMMHDVGIKLEDDSRRAGIGWVLSPSRHGSWMKLGAVIGISPGRSPSKAREEPWTRREVNSLAWAAAVYSRTARAELTLNEHAEENICNSPTQRSCCYRTVLLHKIG